MKTYEGVDIKIHVFVDQFEESGVPYAPGRLLLGKEPQYPLDRRLVGPMASLDDMGKRTYLYPTRTLR
jgi:hypothetical protein